ncbi:enoyl-CoA hydratase/isomerase family protein [Microbulbifer sp. 2205BS26-8]|uniref:enoyl-CoA hydratase/isomerase family protein n=1 Tax=Microbulbifer sp. 2205BS26-8 TaxID=3064386 RepID=UPI00273E14F3|nr:enoyl-CoA hydratase/isomerase family protein [Microbulbifer sp. 2205BS26-8]MDP5208928.1 enoyl-CoA hydratase/isomerase family protein [Microbulbifer sp. 2205BS26-8]
MQTIIDETVGIARHLTLNRPRQRNAISLPMVDELLQKLTEAEAASQTRVLVLRGAEHNFCAGGDIGDMLTAQQNASDGDTDAFYHLNRRFGELLERVNSSSLVVIAVLEGAVMGGGFGLACSADIAIADHSCRFALPETRLGLPPAQIAPFVVARVGLSQARRLALGGTTLKAREALDIGLIHQLLDSSTALEAALQGHLDNINACAPGALATTKHLLLQAAQIADKYALSHLLDDAAKHFSNAIQGSEGREGARAFMEKRAPEWQH